ncbi:BnaC02g23780D [Brassica napus]|uniref:BnaC02g23780D protein n=1 Tax=Brassica napus TaxID=3708 RepID=A0A078FKR8_BRANA|nr:BnaC02g23780D [Brassica napus]
MGDSLPLTLTLPELKYPIGSEPKEKKVSINQHSTSMYISIVESILTADEIERVRGFLGPLKKTRVDASDERVCLAMLLLVESILLPKNNKGTFPLEYVNKAKDMMYPWGRDAYLVLLRSIQKAFANHLEDTSKFELQGYPLVFHLWILESIPLLRDKFSNWAPTVDVPGPIYLCEKYTELENPSLERVLQIEAHKKANFYNELLKVTCILPPIPHDPEDDVSMEDEHSDELESVKDISKKGYKFKADDWKNRLAKLLLRWKMTQKIPN